jgi:mycothiol synthase
MPAVTTDPPLPPGFTLRAAARGDEPIVAALGIAQDLDDLGEADYDEDEVRSEWAAPGFDPERDAWLVFADDGTPAAFASVDGEVARVFTDPRFKGRGLGEHLAARTEDHAHGRGAAEVRQHAAGRNDAARDLLRARGYENDQHYWHMRISLDAGSDVAVPAWPEGLTVRRYVREGDERDVYELIERAFAAVPGNVAQSFDEWRESWGRPGRVDPALTTVVTGKAGLVAVATCGVQDEAHAYLAQLAVDESARGQGLGRALLLETFRLAQATGAAEVTLDVNAANPNATALYESAGMSVVWHSDRWTKRLV